MGSGGATALDSGGLTLYGGRMNDLGRVQQQRIDSMRHHLVVSMLTTIMKSLNLQEAQMSLISEAMDALEAKVAESITVQESAIVLLNGLAERIRALGDAPTVDEINALADAVSSEASRLGAAVVANTDPAAPPATVPGSIVNVDADGNPVG